MNRGDSVAPKLVAKGLARQMFRSHERVSLQLPDSLARTLKPALTLFDSGRRLKVRQVSSLSERIMSEYRKEPGILATHKCGDASKGNITVRSVSANVAEDHNYPDEKIYYVSFDACNISRRRITLADIRSPIEISLHAVERFVERDNAYPENILKKMLPFVQLVSTFLISGCLLDRGLQLELPFGDDGVLLGVIEYLLIGREDDFETGIVFNRKGESYYRPFHYHIVDGAIIILSFRTYLSSEQLRPEQVDRRGSIVELASLSQDSDTAWSLFDPLKIGPPTFDDDSRDATRENWQMLVFTGPTTL